MAIMQCTECPSYCTDRCQHAAAAAERRPGDLVTVLRSDLRLALLAVVDLGGAYAAGWDDEAAERLSAAADAPGTRL